MKKINIKIFLTIAFFVNVELSAVGFNNGWVGRNVVHSNTFLNVTKWTPNAINGDTITVSVIGDTLNMKWGFAPGNRDKWAQCYNVLNQPVSLENIDIFGLNIRGSHCSKNVRFILKLEDFPNRNKAVMIFDGLPSVNRWLEKISILKEQFEIQGTFNWNAVQVISFEVNAIASSSYTGTDSGIISITNFVCDSVDDWGRSSMLEKIQHTDGTELIAQKAMQHIISRQTSTGLLCTWKEDSTANLYGQGLALKALSIEGIWHNGIPKNEAALTAQKLAQFIATNQDANGFWPRKWHSGSGIILEHLENDSTVWMGDFPWPIIGLQSYLNKSRDSSVAFAIQKGLSFLNSLIDSNGKLYTYDFKNNTQKEVTSCEAYAAVIACLFEIRDTVKANKVLDFIENFGWDNDLKYFKEGPNSSRTILFANTWLAPFIAKNGELQKACDALSFVGKVLYTRGPGEPYGFDGTGPVATWYEGTLSYIAAGGPNSQILYNTLVNYRYSDGSVPHYNDTISALGNWVSKWSSIDGTSWLYYASKGITPFENVDLPAIPIQNYPLNNDTSIINPDLSWLPSAGALFYNLQLSTNPEFSELVVDTFGLATTNLKIYNLANNTTYYWRVNATNPGGTSLWTVAWRFTIVPSLPDTVRLLSPANEDTLPTDSVCFIWEKQSMNTDKYCIEIYCDSFLTDTMQVDTIDINEIKILGGFNCKKDYWWRVKGHNSTGWGEFSPLWKFTIIGVAVIPTDFLMFMNGIIGNSGYIQYAIPSVSEVKIRVYNIQGKLLKTFINSHQQPGYYKTNIGIASFPKGIYILDFKAGSKIFRKRISTF